MIKVKNYEDQPVLAITQKIIQCTVVEIVPNVATPNAKTATAVLASGMKLQVPLSVRPDDKVNIDTTTKNLVRQN